jgi:hypothetical protein
MIYIVISVGTIIVKDIDISVQTILSARDAAIYPNAVSLKTGNPVAQDLATGIQKVVPVTQTSITNNSTPPSLSSVQIGDLLINMNLNDEGNYVTATMIYGMTIPGSGVLQALGYTPSQPIPLNAQFSFYKEWQ